MKLSTYIIICIYIFVYNFIYNNWYLFVPLTLLSFLYSVPMPAYLKAFVKICEMFYNLFQSIQAIFNWRGPEGTLEGELYCRKALFNSFKPNIWATLSLQVDLRYSLPSFPPTLLPKSFTLETGPGWDWVFPWTWQFWVLRILWCS